MSSPSASATDKAVPQEGRNLVLCFDGTSDQFNSANTNVVKLYSLLKKDTVDKQITYYQPGVGTYFAPGFGATVFHWLAKTMDEGFAWYLFQHIQDGYRFLMQNYKVGDKIHLFGFSRGAYTARILAAMLYRIGLLPKDNIEQVPFAYKIFKRNNEEVAKGFKAAFCRTVTVDFLGVWDTVASVGIIKSEDLPFLTVNTGIRVFRHAIALDERRGNFRPKFYQRSEIMSKNQSKPAQKTAEGGKDEPVITEEQEVWFVGCHSDIGGGSTPDGYTYSLANIPLRWMIQEIKRAQCDFQWDYGAFEKWDIPITFAQDIHPSTRLAANQASGSGNGTVTRGAVADWPESQLDAVDVMQKRCDELKPQLKNLESLLWWIPECLYTSYTYQDVQDPRKWVPKRSFHCGSGRYVPPKPLFHASVRLRIQEKNGEYKPSAQYTEGTEVYVT